MINVVKICRCCGKEHNISVQMDDYMLYLEGEHVQECFPYLSASDREMFISEICEHCWDSIFGNEDE